MSFKRISFFTFILSKTGHAYIISPASAVIVRQWTVK